jgi:hypothetical protein
VKYEYRVESFAIGKWLKILQGSLQYCQGFLDARKDYAPRNAYRLMRSDGRVMEEVQAREDVDLGMIAGWPTAAQYEAAANRALECAKAIRDREARDAARHTRTSL